MWLTFRVTHGDEMAANAVDTCAAEPPVNRETITIAAWTLLADEGGSGSPRGGSVSVAEYDRDLVIRRLLVGVVLAESYAYRMRC